MKPFRPRSASEQLTAHLREEILAGRLEGRMPGVASLVSQLGVGTHTMVAALEILKREGILEGRGERRSNHIQAEEVRGKAKLRIRMLLYDKSDEHNELSLELRHQIEARGHDIAFAGRTLAELKFDVRRVARLVEETDGDAWIIRAGSKPVLEWFAARPMPSFAMFGRPHGLRMASLVALKSPAVAEALRLLVELGHHRIVLLAREERRKPSPGVLEEHFLDELGRLGILVGSYNLPDWQNDRTGLHRCLDSLFRHTPPSAIFFGESALFFAALQFFSSRGLAAPKNVSLVVHDDNPAFDWFEPELSRIHTDLSRVVPRVMRWVENVASGQEDRRETIIRGKFITGGTIGPPSAASHR